MAFQFHPQNRTAGKIADRSVLWWKNYDMAKKVVRHLVKYTLDARTRPLCFVSRQNSAFKMISILCSFQQGKTTLGGKIVKTQRSKLRL